MQESDDCMSLNANEFLWNIGLLAPELYSKQKGQWIPDQSETPTEFNGSVDHIDSVSSSSSSMFSNNWKNQMETWEKENNFASEQKLPSQQVYKQLERSTSTDIKSFSTFSALDEDSGSLSLPVESQQPADHGFKTQHRGLSRTASDPVTITSVVARNTSLSPVNSSESCHGSSETISSESGALGAGRYKTELCRTFGENGKCKYGDKCQFAHGKAELRSMTRHPKYKTDRCKTYHSTGFCPYGPRCHFIHDVEDRWNVKQETQRVPEQLLDSIQRQHIEKRQQHEQQLQQQFLLANMLQSQSLHGLSNNHPTCNDFLSANSSTSSLSKSPSTTPTSSMCNGTEPNEARLAALLKAINPSSFSQDVFGWNHQICPDSSASINQKFLSQPYLQSSIHNSLNNSNAFTPMGIATTELLNMQSPISCNPLSALPSSNFLGRDESPTIDDVLLVAEVLKVLNLNRAKYQQHNRVPGPTKSYIGSDLNAFKNAPYTPLGESIML